MTSSVKRPGVAATDIQSRKSLGAAETIGRLVVLEGENRGAGVALMRAHATVGRHPTNALVLKDPRVSSVHLELSRRAAGCIGVRDAGSTNGSWLGDHRLTEAELAPGAVLRVGDTLLRVEADENTPLVQL